MYYYFGINALENKLDCTLLNTASRHCKKHKIDNSPCHYKKMIKWLIKNDATPQNTHIIVEPSGIYHEWVALSLHDAGFIVSMIHTIQLHKYCEKIGLNDKVNAINSTLLANYGETYQPAVWKPPATETRILKALFNRYEEIYNDLQREKGRLEKTSIDQSLSETLKYSIKNYIYFLNKELGILRHTIDRHITLHPELHHKRRIFGSLPGVNKRRSVEYTALLASHSLDSLLHTFRY